MEKISEQEEETIMAMSSLSSILIKALERIVISIEASWNEVIDRIGNHSLICNFIVI